MTYFSKNDFSCPVFHSSNFYLTFPLISFLVRISSQPKYTSLFLLSCHICIYMSVGMSLIFVLIRKSAAVCSGTGLARLDRFIDNGYCVIFNSFTSFSFWHNKFIFRTPLPKSNSRRRRCHCNCQSYSHRKRNCMKWNEEEEEKTN